MDKDLIHQNPITLITPVIEGKIKELKKILHDVKEDFLKLNFDSLDTLGTIHFARWVIIDENGQLGNPDQERPKLVFTSNFDGSIDSHIMGLCTQSVILLDKIYTYCEGYPDINNRTPETRHDYLIKWNVPSSSFYRGSPDRSLSQILNENKLRNFLRSKLDERDWKESTATAIEVQHTLQTFVKLDKEYQFAEEQVKLPKVNYFAMVILGLVILLLLPLIILLVLIIQFGYERYDKHFTLKRSALDEDKIKALETYEDLVFQNQFTQLVVMKPGKIRLFTFKLLMSFSKILIKYLFVKGKLMGIPTIHFARWVLFDNNKRVLFFSNFDGSWQQYLGDFIDQSGWGLTGIFSNTTNFPEAKFLFLGGAYDEEHFLAWSRNTELQTQVWYSAYPNLSIKNVNNNSQIRSLLFKKLSESQAQKFLNLI